MERVLIFDFLKEITEEDEKALEKFMSANPAPRLTLADIIMEKITEKQTEIHSKLSDVESKSSHFIRHNLFSSKWKL